jgi:hypothetical protein
LSCIRIPWPNNRLALCLQLSKLQVEIKQFGPCELVAEARLSSEKESLTAEAQLHQQFAPWRKPETEIFCFTAAQLELVKAAMAVVSGS